MGFANNVIPGWMVGEMTARDLALLMGAEVKDLKFYQAAFEIGNAQSWEDWHYDGTYTWRNAHGEMDIPGLGHVKVVDRTEDDRGENIYGEYSQGSEGELTVTFEVTFTDGEVRHFRKIGIADSYGSVVWRGDFQEVRATEKTVTVFAPVS